MNSMKRSPKTRENQPLSTCQVSCTKANSYIDIMLSDLVQYQGKAGFFKLNFQNGISRNSGKCELGWYLHRQSHIQYSSDKTVNLFMSNLLTLSSNLFALIIYT